MSFHTEMLHDDEVWRHAKHAATSMSRQGVYASFFVYPYRAQMAGVDITSRVQEIAGLGHEIAQHTHFYGPVASKPPLLRNHLNDENVAKCIERDYETLTRMGTPPEGFVAGSWLVTPWVLETVCRLGFAYDCSARLSTWPTDKRERPYWQWADHPNWYPSSGESVVRIPTTCSLRQWFRWRGSGTIDGSTRYHLVCLHDSDLVMASFRIMLRLAKLRSLGASIVTTSRLARIARDSLSSKPP